MYFSIISFSYQKLSLQELSNCQISPEDLEEKLKLVRARLKISEIFCLNTCNRVVFFISKKTVPFDIFTFFSIVYPTLSWIEFENKIHIFHNKMALRHIFRLAASLESMIIGEREILTQLRTAFEWAQQRNFVKHDLRIIVREAISNAKRSFLQTNLAKKEVSVSSIAYKILQSKYSISVDTSILAIGAGLTNQSLLKFLIQNTELKNTKSENNSTKIFQNIKIYNRTLSKAQEFLDIIQKKNPMVSVKKKLSAFPLEILGQIPEKADILLICTGSQFLTLEKYQTIFESSPKVIVDLSMPADVSVDILKNYEGIYIGMAEIQEQAQENLSFRKESVPEVEKIIEAALVDVEKLLAERQKIQKFSALPDLLRKNSEKVWQNFYEEDFQTLDLSLQKTIRNMILDLEQQHINAVMSMVKVSEI